MADYQERVAELSQERQKLEEAQGELLRRIGEYAYKQTANLPIDAEDPALAAVRESTKELSQLEEQLSQIAEAERRQAGIKQEITNATSRIHAVEGEMAPLFEEIGRSAFAVYQDNPFLDPEYAELFSELQRETEALEEVDRELVEEERDIDEKPFLDRMLARGKATWLKSRRQGREHSLEKQYRRVGKAIVETGFVDAVEDPGLNAAVRPYSSQRQRIDTLKERIRSLEADLEHDRAELKETSIEDPSRPRLRDRRVSLEEKLAAAQRDLGRRVLKSVKKEAVPEPIKDEAEATRKLDRQIAAKIREEKRIDRELRRSRLEAEAAALDQRARELRGKATEIEKERDQLRQEIKELEERT